MRKLLIAGAAAGLIAVPAAAIAATGEPVVETDPAAESQKGPTTDKALHSQGVGAGDGSRLTEGRPIRFSPGSGVRLTAVKSKRGEPCGSECSRFLA
jgi:hypothetical protein